MIVFLYGENSYNSYRNLNGLINKYKEKHKESVNFFEFNFEEENDWDRLRSAVQVLPLFKENKLIVVKNIFSGKESDNFKDLIENNNLIEDKNTFLIIWEKLPSSKLKTANFLLKNTSVKQNDFVQPEGNKLSSWVKKEFQERGLEIQKEAIDSLILYAGSDLWRLANEIDKLSVFKREGIVNKDDINLLVVPDLEQNVFQLTDAILANNKEKSFEVLEKIVGRSNDPKIFISILAVITSQFRNFLIIKDLMDRSLAANQIAGKAGLHPYVVKISIPALHRFELDRLKIIYEKISSMESILKSKNLNPLLIFNLFLLSV